MTRVTRQNVSIAFEIHSAPQRGGIVDRPHDRHIAATGGQKVCTCIERAATGVYRRPEFILDKTVDSPGLAAAEIGVEQANRNLALLSQCAGTLLGRDVGGIDCVDPATDELRGAPLQRLSADANVERRAPVKIEVAETINVGESGIAEFRGRIEAVVAERRVLAKAVRDIAVGAVTVL